MFSRHHYTAAIDAAATGGVSWTPPGCAVWCHPRHIPANSDGDGPAHSAYLCLCPTVFPRGSLTDSVSDSVSQSSGSYVAGPNRRRHTATPDRKATFPLDGLLDELRCLAKDVQCIIGTRMENTYGMCTLGRPS